MWPNPKNPREPQWLPDDFDAALEWQEADQNKCPGCGRPRDECFSDDAPDYEAKPVVCWSCQERDIAAKRFAEANGGQTPGVYFVTEEAGEQ